MNMLYRAAYLRSIHSSKSVTRRFITQQLQYVCHFSTVVKNSFTVDKRKNEWRRERAKRDALEVKKENHRQPPPKASQKMRGTVQSIQHPRKIVQYLTHNIDDPKMDISVFTVAIHRCAQLGSYDGCVEILEYAFKCNVKRDIEFYTRVFTVFSNMDRIIDIYPKYFEIMTEKDKIWPDEYVGTALLKGCKQRGQTRRAENILANVYEPYNLVWGRATYVTLITIFGNAGDIIKADQLFHECLNNKSIAKSTSIFGSIFSALSNNGNYFANNFKRKGYKKMSNDDFYQHIESIAKKILQYKNLAESEYKIQFCHVQYCALMNAFLKVNNPLKTIEMFDEALNNKIIPTIAMFDVLQNANLRLLQECEEIQNKTCKIAPAKSESATKYFKTITVDIPQQMEEQKIEMDYKTPAVMYDALLNYYLPCEWNKPQVIQAAEKWKLQFNRGHWHLSENDLLLEFHGMRIREVIFWLRYAFAKEIEGLFVEQGSKYYGKDLQIIVGQGKHKKGIDKSVNDSRRSNKYAIITELQSRTPAIQVREHENNSGVLIIEHKHLVEFYKHGSNVDENWLGAVSDAVSF